MSSGRVASNSAQTESFRSAAAPTQAALCTFECVRRGFAALFARAAACAPFGFSLRSKLPFEMLRISSAHHRSAFRVGSRIHRRSASPGFVARVYALFQRYAPRHACASARLSRTAALRVAKLAHRAFNPRLARPTLSIRASCPPRRKTVFAPQSAASLVGVRSAVGQTGRADVSSAQMEDLILPYCTGETPMPPECLSVARESGRLARAVPRSPNFFTNPLAHLRAFMILYHYLLIGGHKSANRQARIPAWKRR